MNKRNQLTEKADVVREPVATYEIASHKAGSLSNVERKWWNSCSESYRKYVTSKVDEALSGVRTGKYSNKKDFSKWLYEKANIQPQR